MNCQNNTLALPVIKEEYDDVMITVLEGWSPLDGNIATNPSQPLVPTTSQSVSNLFSPTVTTSNDSTACSTGPLPNLVKAHKSAPSVLNRQKFDYQRHQIMLESTNIGPFSTNVMSLVPSSTKAQNNSSITLLNIQLQLKQTQKQLRQTQEELKKQTKNLMECRGENELVKKKYEELQLDYSEFKTNSSIELNKFRMAIAMLNEEISQLKDNQHRSEPSTVRDISTCVNQSNDANMDEVMIPEKELLDKGMHNSDKVFGDGDELPNTATDNYDHSLVESFDKSVSARQESNQNDINLQKGSNLHNLTKRKQSQPNRSVEKSKNIIENQQHCESLVRLLTPSNEQEQMLPSEDTLHCFDLSYMNSIHSIGTHPSPQSGVHPIAPVPLESTSTTVQSINEIEQAKTGKHAGKYEFSDCDKVYTSRSSLNTDRGQIHNGEQCKFKCTWPQCGKEFTRNFSLTTHMQIHNGEPRKFKCTWPQCDKEFGKKYTLTAHMQVHTGEQSRKCTECGKMFTQNVHLRKHMLTHSNARPFKCTWENCQKAFKDNSNLERHLRIHTGEQSRKCTECGKMFTQNVHLRKHMLTHSNARPFKCTWENCQKAFKDNSNLERHLRIHTVEQSKTTIHSGNHQFKCTWENCQKAFNDSSNLTRHLRIHTGERPFKCDRANCTKAFIQSNGLTKHLRTHK